jgi:hypothetical protein
MTEQAICLMSSSELFTLATEAMHEKTDSHAHTLYCRYTPRQPLRNQILGTGEQAWQGDQGHGAFATVKPSGGARGAGMTRAGGT